MNIIGANNRHNELIMDEWLQMMNDEGAKLFAVIAINKDGAYKVASLANVSEYVLAKSLENIVSELNSRQYKKLTKEFEKGLTYNAGQKVINMDKKS